MRTIRLLALVLASLPFGLWPGMLKAQRAEDSHAPASLDRETPQYIDAYCRFNKIATPVTLKPGMKLDEFVKVLGEPTSRYRLDGRRAVEDAAGNWATWYHNPGGLVVAPFITVRIEDGAIARLVANRR